MSTTRLRGAAKGRQRSGAAAAGSRVGGQQAEDKKKMCVQNKLSSMLFKQKELLKKDIAKKRALLEKELSLEITKVSQ